ncbi:MAG: glycosyltransferase, partial [Ignavibacteria bacterium]|nr:glycosyltransferase [Ignavibacteria bacterium]
LAAKGHNVIVVDFNENRIGSLEKNKLSRTGIGEVELISLPNNGLPIVKYLSAKLQFPKILKKLIQQNSIDVVLLYSVFINGTGAISVCRNAGVPIVYRAIDAYHRLRKNKMESWLLLQSEKYIYNNVDAISVTNKKMENYIREITRNKISCPVHITDHGVDTSHFKRLTINDVLAKKLLIEPNDFVCVFLGTTYSFSRLDSLVYHMERLRKAIPGFKLLILGSGDLDEPIRDAVAETEQFNFVLQPGMIPYHDLPDYLSLAKLAINPFKINDITRDIIPIKILQYLASELPVVSTPLPDLVAKIPHDISGVFYSESDDIEIFVENIIKIAMRINGINYGKQARNYVIHNHSMDRVINELEHIL